MKPFVVTLSIVLLLATTYSVGGAAPKETFLHDEAGMAAYFSFSGPTNLESNLLRNLFRTVTSANATYLIGYIPTNGYEGQVGEDVKVFIHNDGWVVAYYPKDAASAKAIDGEFDPKTRMEKVLERVAAAMDVLEYEIRLVHFQFPGAEHWLRVMRRRTEPGISTFNIRLPATNDYFERGFSLRCTNVWSYAAFFLDGPEINRTSWFSYGVIPPASMVVNARHEIGIGKHATLGYTWGELSILYAGPGDFVIDGADWVLQEDLPPVPDGLLLAAADVPRFFETYLPVVRSK